MIISSRKAGAILVIFICYSFSIYIMLCSGTLFQYFTSILYDGKCYDCSMKADYISQYFVSSTMWSYFIPASIMLTTVFFSRKRIYSYIFTLLVSWCALTLHDIVTYQLSRKLTFEVLIVNVLYNLVGAMILSLFLCLSKSAISYLNKKKQIPIFFCAMLPLISAIFLSLLLTLLVYLFYAREPVNIEITLSENANLAYQGGKNKNDSFGFLNEKRTETPTLVDMLSSSEINYSDNKGMTSSDIYAVSGCYATPTLFRGYKEDKNKTFKSIRRIKFESKYPGTGFVDGSGITVTPGNASQFSIIKEKENFVVASRVMNSKINFDTNNNNVRFGYVIMPLKDDDFLNSYEYSIKIDDKKVIVRNTISPLSRDDKTTKMECHFTQIDGSQNEVLIEGKYLTGFLINVYPDDVILFKDSPSFDVKSGLSFFKKEYAKNDVIFNDISNGSLSSLHGKGFSSLIINGHERPIKNETEILITNGNLVGFVTKDKKIKINGDADLLFVDDKVMNLRKISVLQSKLSLINSSVSEFIKYFLGTSLLLLILKFLYSYFKNEVVDNLLD